MGIGPPQAGGVKTLRVASDTDQNLASRKGRGGVSSAALSDRKSRARAWFERLRDDICAALEKLEDELPQNAPHGEDKPGRFLRTPWSRQDHTGGEGGGGVMAMMNGRVFEKAGIHVSTVHGQFA